MEAYWRDEEPVSWGRVVRAAHKVAKPYFCDELSGLIESAQGTPLLAVGLMRSYGDSNLNPGGALIGMGRLDRVHFFDTERGVLRADAGLSIDALIRFILPKGWFPAVVPGTRFVTLGGAVANDVHGKNHYGCGTFGGHVRRLALRRTDGSMCEVSSVDEPDLFAATIGGLGLTGVIEWVEIALKRMPGAFIDAEEIPFDSFEEFLALSRESEYLYDYTVAWVDCAGNSGRIGRGLFSRGRPAEAGDIVLHARSPRLGMPIEIPSFALNSASIRAFNAIYYHGKKARARRRRVHYASFFFPLDSIADWNRMYGSRGMYQHQCVIPEHAAGDAVPAMLSMISRYGGGSFLGVLKSFGGVESPGMLSFPMRGVTLALDFPNRGDDTLRLMVQLDRIVMQTGGRIYPAKDARMSRECFVLGYPKLPRFMPHVDHGLSSGFWRRVTA